MNIIKQLKILEAFKEGKTIQCRCKDDDFDTWLDIQNSEYCFNFSEYEYRIKPKSLPRSWREYCNSNTRIDKFFIDENSCIAVCSSTDNLSIYEDKNLCDSDAEAQAFLALMQLRLLRKAYVGDWEADFTNGKPKFCICNVYDTIFIHSYSQTNNCLSFPTKELAQQFFDNFKNIIEIAKPLI